MNTFEAANRRAIAERLNDENITNIIIQYIGHPVPFQPESPYYRAETAHEPLWTEPPLHRGYEPLNWRIIDLSETEAMINALTRCFAENIDGPLDPESFLRLHRIIKQAAYRRMFYADIVGAELPWTDPGPGGWKWWSTEGGREGRKIVRRKVKFYVWIFGLDWVMAKFRDWFWAILLGPMVVNSLRGETGAKAALKAAFKSTGKEAGFPSE
ncbi:hypothetical protein EG328_003285 [Venturia inaequalis]|uniref:Uncharacterized protein n=1 Tax=Venturia inaequalis TaxID=5025 RepID=A0A8H3US23_VENIN|nr:hypothetical protein EG328_003285 [Venturia inaequalis]